MAWLIVYRCSLARLANFQLSPPRLMFVLVCYSYAIHACACFYFSYSLNLVRVCYKLCPQYLWLFSLQLLPQYLCLFSFALNIVLVFAPATPSTFVLVFASQQRPQYSCFAEQRPQCWCSFLLQLRPPVRDQGPPHGDGGGVGTIGRGCLEVRAGVCPGCVSSSVMLSSSFRYVSSSGRRQIAALVCLVVPHGIYS